MRRKQIAEAAYLLLAVLFVGICIGTGDKSLSYGQEAFSGNADITSAPVHDTIPTPEGVEGSLADGNPEGQNPVQNGEDGTGPDNRGDGDSGEQNGSPEPEGQMPGAVTIKNENYESYSNDMKAWWFRRNTEHRPSGSGEEFPIADYSAYYLDTAATEEEKVIYLTFDCGYENGFTPSILDTLAEKNVKALFFVTKDFIVKNADYVKRMKAEGHLVGNHTVRHLSSPELTPEELAAELSEVAVTMKELTGYDMDPFFRPPMGEYSERTLKATQDMGYVSIFWSMAYYDYDINNQPGKDYVTEHFATYHHNGCIVLMHNVSESNTQALGDVIELLRETGYRFGTMTEFAK